MSDAMVLLVEDEKEVRLSYTQALDLAGFAVRAFAGAEGVLDLVGYAFPGVVVSDIRLGGMDGMTLLSRVRAIDPDIPVVLVTGHSDTPLAVSAMREGAYDFIEKPCPPRLLAEVVSRALDRRRLVLENRRLRTLADGRRDSIEARLQGRTPAMVDLRYRIRALADADADVFVVGETGTGKEVVARALHDIGARAARPFVVVDCAALPTGLAESELFGHEAGAVSGAARARFGRFEQAHGGTVLLDEVAQLPSELQARLARVIEDRTVTRVGSHSPVPVDLRFVATGRGDPQQEVAAGRLRADLFYRLNVVTLRVPTLAERREDVPLLFLQLVSEAFARLGREEVAVPPSVLVDVANRPWPGNVRELRNAAERYVLGLGFAGLAETREAGASGRRLAERVADYERSLIAGALATSGGSLKAVYEQLGISRKTLYEKMQKFGLDKRDFGEDEAGEEGGAPDA
ncbi:sigma-54 dependent transcriptional regulator [Aurantimonas sp. Leaf443]|uniref:sigma-54-dependent transcriptional regulator n=1 Tax=Aurantimonas sp. Leaf443 TaxID=1736378 RepID=UPI0006F30376|nr:sigma-54 dependent transcriptional regulator [Aurantimonas sp. Leaf443]KQT87994.1 Fis family transcriptional regulator [Aurantimonas sp. Leaf443]